MCSKCSFEFDSWFYSSKEFDRLAKKKIISCIKCGSIKVKKTIMSPNVSSSKKSKNKKKENEIKDTIIKYQKFIKENFKYVGDDFSYQARNLYYNKENSQSIYGNASKEEIDELNEEGIETVSMPWVESSKH